MSFTIDNEEYPQKRPDIDILELLGVSSSYKETLVHDLYDQVGALIVYIYMCGYMSSARFETH